MNTDPDPSADAFAEPDSFVLIDDILSVSGRFVRAKTQGEAIPVVRLPHNAKTDMGDDPVCSYQAKPMPTDPQAHNFECAALGCAALIRFSMRVEVAVWLHGLQQSLDEALDMIPRLPIRPAWLKRLRRALDDARDALDEGLALGSGTNALAPSGTKAPARRCPASLPNAIRERVIRKVMAISDAAEGLETPPLSSLSTRFPTRPSRRPRTWGPTPMTLTARGTQGQSRGEDQDRLVNIFPVRPSTTQSAATDGDAFRIGSSLADWQTEP